MKLVRVTPEMATQWLETQGVNRNLSSVTMYRYSRAMADGAWRSDPQMPLRFNEDGRLVDGQHRLSAVVEYGRPIDFFVTTVTQQTLDLIHECKPRTMADRLVLSGKYDLAHAKLVAALGGALCDRMYTGKIYIAPRKQSLSSGAFRPDQIVRAFEWAGIDPVEIIEHAKPLYALQPSKMRLATQTMLGYLLAQNAPNTYEMLYQLVSDEHPNREPSISALRRQLGNSNYSVSVRLAMVAKAINSPDVKMVRVGTSVEDLKGGKFERMSLCQTA